VVLAHLVVLPVGRPHIPGRRAVAASVLEAVVTLTSLHTHRIIVGHNIGYDRARVAEEYNIAQSKNCFIDTMSLLEISDE